MKKNHLLATMKTCLLMTAGLFLASCAQDGFDDETFTGTYGGYQLATPDASSVKVKSSSDKTEQTITWNTVSGAISYVVSIYEGENKKTNWFVEPLSPFHVRLVRTTVLKFRLHIMRLRTMLLLKGKHLIAGILSSWKSTYLQVLIS